MSKLRSLPLCALVSALSCSLAVAQSAAPAVRIVSQIDENHLITLKGNVNPSANAKNDRGLVSSQMAMGDLTLVLCRSAEQQAAFDAFVESQYDTGSPNFHQWLTPTQIGERFGPAQGDIDAISRWLGSQGFSVLSVSPDRMTVNFSGTAGQAQSAFHTEIHNLSVDGIAHIANMTDPQIPEALSSVVIGVKGLHNFFARPLSRVGSKVQYNSNLHGWQRLQDSPAASLAAGGVPAVAAPKVDSLRPMFGYSGGTSPNTYPEEDVTPYDFATIYNVTPLWNKSINGAGQKIAIVGTSDIVQSDITAFKTAFGLPAGTAPVIAAGVNGIDPGVCAGSTNACNDGDLEENSLDVEWSGGVAPGAQIVEVTSGYNSQTNPTNDPIFFDAQWIISNATATGNAVSGARIISISYGECELGQGTASNVAYRNLWQTAYSAGIAVFIASGDSGAPACDQNLDYRGVPYTAQYGLAVNGTGSTPFNTSVGGTDFSWCKPSYDSKGNYQGCLAANAATYWSTTDNSTNHSNALGYVPETPWNDSCLNPIWATYLDSIAPLFGITTPTNAEAACNMVYNDWLEIDQLNESNGGGQFVLAPYIDSIGGGGGASNCVVNSSTSTTTGTCTSGSTTTGSSLGNLTLVNNGWPKPSWQTGITGIPNDGVRDLPDVSFFAGDGSLDSATIICIAADGATCSSSNLTGLGNGGTAEELGGTSVATPQMAGVMALINQNVGSTQGNPNAVLYKLASMQNYSSCSAESVSAGSASCYFNDIDQGTNSMPCNYNGLAVEGGAVQSGGGWGPGTTYTGAASPNCSISNSGDVVGSLTGYAAGTAFDLATGLGSLNVANVANASGVWTKTGSATATVTVTPASGNIAPDANLNVTVTVAGTSGTPTGTVTLAGSGYTSSVSTLTGGAFTFTIPGGSLTGATNPFTATLTATYSGDGTYAQNTGSNTVTVTKRTPAVTVTPAVSTSNSNVPINVTVAVTGAGVTPTGTVTLTGGSYTSLPVTLTGGSATFTIPPNTFTSSGVVSLNAAYSGDTTYVTGTGSNSVTVVLIVVVSPTVTVTPTPTSIDSGQSLSLLVVVGGGKGAGTGTVTVAGGGYTSAATALAGGSATITVPANSLSVGTDTLTASYLGDINYTTGTGTVNVGVTQSVYALSATTPTAAKAGTSTSSTITGSTSATLYTGTVTVSSCSLTTSPTNAVSLPTCTASGSITYNGGAATGSGIATVSSTAASASLVYPKLGNSRGWLGAGGSVLAFLVFLGIPARRRSWRAMLGMIVLLVALGSMAACGSGGSSGGGGTTVVGTTAGSYTFTVTGQGSDLSHTQESTTFTVAIN